MIGAKHAFLFDTVLNELSRQFDVYSNCVLPLIKGLFEGFNASIFAYGQTGSGKSHSMFGQLRDETEGIIPRTIRDIFQIIEYFNVYCDSYLGEGQMSSSFTAALSLSFLEIYNDDLKDLLHVEIPSKDISIREDREGKIFVTGAKEEVVRSVEDCFRLLERGLLNRSTAETMMNASSSRSHAILSFSLQLIFPSTLPLSTTSLDIPLVPDPSSPSSDSPHLSLLPPIGGTAIHSKIHLVDLAGSERVKRTGAGGIRLKESVGINQGLLSLGKVIRALTTPAASSTPAFTAHIPYRESKLTRFLQDSLGGNSRTVMLACVSPSDINLHETLSTLQYAFRVKGINNKAVQNISVSRGLGPAEMSASGPSIPGIGWNLGTSEGTLVALLRSQLAEAQSELSVIKSAGSSEPSGPSSTQTDSDSLLLHEVFDVVLCLQQLAETALSPIPPSFLEEARQSMDMEVERLFSTQGSFSLPASTPPSTFSKYLASHPDSPRLMWDTLKSLDQVKYVLSHLLNSESSSPSWSRLTGLSSQFNQYLNQRLKDLSPTNQNQPISLSNSELSALRSELAREKKDRSLLEESFHQTQIELFECREDLKRDEEIFGEKIKELKSYRKQCHQLQQDVSSLQQQLSDLTLKFEQQQRRNQWLETELRSKEESLNPSSESKDFKSPVTPPRNQSKKESKTQGLGSSLLPHQIYRPSTPIPAPGDSFLSPGSSRLVSQLSELNIDKDDLDISLRVVSSEPHVSQLMEDLETISKEKEKILLEKQLIQDRLSSAAALAQQQNERFESHQKKVAGKLLELEGNIARKQQQLEALQKTHSKANEESEEAKNRLRVMEEERERLRTELQQIGEEKMNRISEIEEERKKRAQVESRLQEATLLLSDLQSQLDAARGSSPSQTSPDKFRSDAKSCGSDLGFYFLAEVEEKASSSRSPARDRKDNDLDPSTILTGHQNLSHSCYPFFQWLQPRLREYAQGLRAVEKAREYSRRVQSSLQEYRSISTEIDKMKKEESLKIENKRLEKERREKELKSELIRSRNEAEVSWKEEEKLFKSKLKEILTKLKSLSLSYTNTKKELRGMETEGDHEKLVSKKQFLSELASSIRQSETRKVQLETEYKAMEERWAKERLRWEEEEREIDQRLTREFEKEEETEGRLEIETKEEPSPDDLEEEGLGEKGRERRHTQIRLSLPELEEELEAMGLEIEMLKEKQSTEESTARSLGLGRVLDLLSSLPPPEDSEEPHYFSMEDPQSPSPSMSNQQDDSERLIFLQPSSSSPASLPLVVSLALKSEVQSFVEQHLRFRTNKENSDREAKLEDLPRHRGVDSTLLSSLLSHFSLSLLLSNQKISSLLSSLSLSAALLEQKTSDHEELSLLLARQRNDMLGKLDRQQKESEDKVSFLLQQLRQLEGKLRPSSSVSSSQISLPLPGQSRPTTPQPPLPPSSSPLLVSLSQSFPSMSIIGGDQGRAEERTGMSGNEAGLVKKWQSERTRREQLEKKNLELNRELKGLKESLQHSGDHPRERVEGIQQTRQVS